MVFSSVLFLWIFLPTILLFYYASILIKNSSYRIWYKNIVLLIASLIFYAAGGLWYLLVMLVSITGNYFLALGINKVSVSSETPTENLGGGAKNHLAVLNR